MSTGNVIAIFAFLAVLLLGLFSFTVVDIYKKRPTYRVKSRLFSLTSSSRTNINAKIMAELQRAQSDARRRRVRESMGTLGYHLNRLDTIAGQHASRRFVIAAAALVVIGLLTLILGLVPRSFLSALLLLLVIPSLALITVYNFLIQRFNTRFINQLPDAMDAIVRASQAGVPVTQSIRDVGNQFQAPLGPEFKRMGDALLLGNDIEEVLDEAGLRIRLADFSFFSVCVLLQRESGGSIVEALENLSSIIRARRDLALKARALTAEGRLSGIVIAIIPFVILGMLYFLNRDYVMVLFTTETGRMLLWIAAGMLTIGLLAIRHITNLKV